MTRTDCIDSSIRAGHIAGLVLDRSRQARVDALVEQAHSDDGHGRDGHDETHRPVQLEQQRGDHPDLQQAHDDHQQAEADETTHRR